MKITRLLLALTLFTTMIYAADPTPAPQISSEVKYQLLSEYKSFLLAQQNLKEKANKFQNTYNGEIMRLPKGSSISIDPDKDEVTVIAPKEEVKEPVKK